MGAPAPARSAPSYLPVLLFGCAILVISTGVRSSFGLFLPEMTQARGWSRETFSFAIAIQNLMWGLGGSFLGAMADKYGSMRTLLLGALLYVIGFLGMAWAESGAALSLSAGVVMGIAIGGTSFGIILATLGRIVPAEQRSMAFGIGVAAGSFGQFLMMPLEGQLILRLGWQDALLVLSAMVLLIVPLAFGLREPGFHGSAPIRRTQSARHAFAEALRYKSYLLLTAGYFVCGFQVVFIGVHMPSYLRDHGLGPQVASYALALIGLFNVFGTYISGTLGQRMQKRHILAFIYFARAVVISVFLLVPLSPLSVYVFSAVIGALWLSTVPPTNATVAQIFGVQHLSMLSGFVFFSHQIGSFLGVWLGGYLYDTTGSYDIVWYIAIVLGVAAGLINLPVREGAIARATPQAA